MVTPSSAILADIMANLSGYWPEYSNMSALVILLTSTINKASAGFSIAHHLSTGTRL